MGYKWMKTESGDLKVHDDSTGREVSICRGEEGLEVFAGGKQPEAIATNMAQAIIFALDELKAPFALLEKAA